jgi:hypothetical protein
MMLGKLRYICWAHVVQFIVEIERAMLLTKKTSNVNSKYKFRIIKEDRMFNYKKGGGNRKFDKERKSCVT